VTGAGPIGLLAALIGVQRGLEVHVLDRVTDGPKPALVADLGATYHASSVQEVARTFTPDVVIEATRAASAVIDATGATAAYGITCLTGVSSPGAPSGVDVGASNRHIVLQNDVVVGTVNANPSHYRSGVAALSRAAPSWLERLIT